MKNSLASSTLNNFYLTGYLFIAVFLVINTANQIMFKTVAMGPGGSDYLALIVEPLFYLCIVLFMGQAVAWLAVLRRLPLSYAYPFTSLTVITILASGAFFFGEPISLGNILGALIIMIGVAVIAGGNQHVRVESLDSL